ncbi:MAG: hypothetical protein U1G07_13810 [Verrucomicrobiota bacterium]
MRLPDLCSGREFSQEAQGGNALSGTSRSLPIPCERFARDLGIDHSALSQILRQRRNASPRMIARLGRRLKLAPALIADACLEQHAEVIIRLLRLPGFCPNSRWIATRTGIPLDAVNTTLHRLLQRGDLLMKSVDSWKTKGPAHA